MKNTLLFLISLFTFIQTSIGQQSFSIRNQKYDFDLQNRISYTYALEKDSNDFVKISEYTGERMKGLGFFSAFQGIILTGIGIATLTEAKDYFYFSNSNSTDNGDPNEPLGLGLTTLGIGLTGSGIFLYSKGANLSKQYKDLKNTEIDLHLNKIMNKKSTGKGFMMSGLAFIGYGALITGIDMAHPEKSRERTSSDGSSTKSGSIMGVLGPLLCGVGITHEFIGLSNWKSAKRSLNRVYEEKPLFIPPSQNLLEKKRKFGAILCASGILLSRISAIALANTPKTIKTTKYYGPFSYEVEEPNPGYELAQTATIAGYRLQLLVFLLEEGTLNI